MKTKVSIFFIKEGQRQKSQTLQMCLFFCSFLGRSNLNQFSALKLKIIFAFLSK